MKKENDYFALMERSSGFAVEIAKALEHTLASFDAFKLKEALDTLHAIEHNADDSKHDMMERITKEFITPIEREDLIALACELDNITDCVEDVLRKMYMMNVTVLRNDIAPHTSLLVKITGNVQELMTEFRNYKKSRTIKDKIIEINRLESDGDKLYEDSARRLFTETTSAADVFIWSEIYRRLEHCYDACEHAADVVESVIMKNS